MRVFNFSEPCDVDLNLDFGGDQEWEEGHDQDGHNYRFVLWNQILFIKGLDGKLSNQIIKYCKNPSFFWSLDADGKKKVETFVEEEEGAAGFGEDFFKNRIRLLTFIFFISFSL